MERLTGQKIGQSYPLKDKASSKVGLFTDYDGFYAYFEAVNRLGAIEDILGDEYDLGRLREAVEKQAEYEQFMEKWKQVAEIAGAVKKVGAEKAAELVQAYRDGRCVVLPIVKQKDRDSLFDALSEAVSSWGDMSAGEKKLSEAILAAMKGEQNGKDL